MDYIKEGFALVYYMLCLWIGSICIANFKEQRCKKKQGIRRNREERKLYFMAVCCFFICLFCNVVEVLVQLKFLYWNMQMYCLQWELFWGVLLIGESPVDRQKHHDTIDWIKRFRVIMIGCIVTLFISFIF